jgi:small conductance mechanosensitive channel
MARRFIFLFFALVSLVLNAAETSPAEPPADVERERIEELIATLESPTARKEFVANLKTLLEQQQETADESPWQATEWFNIDKISRNLAKQYTGHLEKLGLSKTASEKSIVLILYVAVILVLVYGNNKAANFFNGKLDGLRRRFRLAPQRFDLYFSIQKWFGYLLAGVFLIFLLTRVFWPAATGRTEDFQAMEAITYAFATLLLALLFASIWEMANFAMEYGAGKNRKLSRARLDTLLPIVRNSLLVIMTIILVLIILSETGVDITPLLAGAGVIGIAIGFGAQTLISDLITGFIIIFEDLVAVGDVIRIGDRVGIVEKITIRKIDLRDLDGTVYTVPFSEISIVDNLTKGYNYYLMDIGVAYREDIDDVMACLQDISRDLRNDDKYGNAILEDLEIMGVDRFADSAVIVRARLKTRAHDKWFVGREFNRRMKAAFDERNIEIPFPHRTLYFGEGKEGEAPSAHVRLLGENSPAPGEHSSRDNGKDSENSLESRTPLGDEE